MVRGLRPLCVVVSLVVLASLGCVRREMVILTNPSGAKVELDSLPVMTERELIDREGEVIEVIRPVPRYTPLRLPFSWYGTHKFVIYKEGYERAERIVHMRPPWYEHFPIDFFSDNVWPWTVEDIRTFTFELVKEKSVRDASQKEKAALRDALLDRAEEYRNVARERVATPVERPPTVPPPPGLPVPEPKPDTE